jgi:chromosome segregation ATPase
MPDIQTNTERAATERAATKRAATERAAAPDEQLRELEELHAEAHARLERLRERRADVDQRLTDESAALAQLVAREAPERSLAVVRRAVATLATELAELSAAVPMAEQEAAALAAARDAARHAVAVERAEGAVADQVATLNELAVALRQAAPGLVALAEQVAAAAERAHGERKALRASMLARGARESEVGRVERELERLVSRATPPCLWNVVRALRALLHG